jgi:hypothetical protein
MRPSPSSTRTTSNADGIGVEPVASTMAARRCHEPSTVQIGIPRWSRSTATGPAGVSMAVPRTRQIGQVLKLVSRDVS